MQIKEAQEIVDQWITNDFYLIYLVVIFVFVIIVLVQIDALFAFDIYYLQI